MSEDTENVESVLVKKQNTGTRKSKTKLLSLMSVTKAAQCLSVQMDGVQEKNQECH